MPIRFAQALFYLVEVHVLTPANNTIIHLISLSFSGSSTVTQNTMYPFSINPTAPLGTRRIGPEGKQDACRNAVARTDDHFNSNLKSFA